MRVRKRNFPTHSQVCDKAVLLQNLTQEYTITAQKRLRFADQENTADSKNRIGRAKIQPERLNFDQKIYPKWRLKCCLAGPVPRNPEMAFCYLYPKPMQLRARKRPHEVKHATPNPRHLLSHVRTEQPKAKPD